MNKLLTAMQAKELSNQATIKYELEKKEAEKNQWLKDLKIIEETLSTAKETINEAIRQEASKTGFSAPFIISMVDLSYADEYNYYHHIVLEGYSKKMFDEFVDRLINEISLSNFIFKSERNKNIGICPKLKTMNDELFFSLNLDWS